MQVSGRSLPVSVGVLICFFTFEFPSVASESGANMFHNSGHSALLVLVFIKTANL